MAATTATDAVDDTSNAIGSVANHENESTTSSPVANPTSNNPTTTNTQILTPFAVIDEVFPNSPASIAGIQLNDLLLKFDNVDSTNHDDFAAIAKLLPGKEGKVVNVKVRRSRDMDWGEVIETVDLELKPKKWDGRGLLGCHISKYDG